MVNNITPTDNLENSSLPDTDVNNKRHLKVCEINHRNNLHSDYTEKMKELEKSFDYASNRDYYWSDPELSILYGTPLYEEASPTQKLVLNHLYWPAQYDYIAAGESSVIHYNQVTSGVFNHFSEYETLCSTLDLETEQEYSHINVFQKVSYKMKVALFGKSLLGINPSKNKQSSSHKKTNKKVKKTSPLNWQYKTLRFINKMMLQNADYCYSTHLQELEAKNSVIPAVKGYIGSSVPKNFHKFLTFNWGSSPFLACQHYTYRFTANLALKNYEYRYTQHFRQLEKTGEFIPTPTAISYYHLLDESFHTTTSQLIGRDMYKDFAQPTAYEKLVANVIIYMIQKGLLGELSGGMMSGFREDSNFLTLYYKILRSPVFDMSHQDTVYWLEKCLCQEHEGFHTNSQYHHKLYTDLCRFTSNLDYLWPINREMKIMAGGASINNAIHANKKALHEFSNSIVAE